MRWSETHSNDHFINENTVLPAKKFKALLKLKYCTFLFELLLRDSTAESIAVDVRIILLCCS